MQIAYFAPRDFFNHSVRFDGGKSPAFGGYRHLPAKDRSANKIVPLGAPQLPF